MDGDRTVITSSPKHRLQNLNNDGRGGDLKSLLIHVFGRIVKENIYFVFQITKKPRQHAD